MGSIIEVDNVCFKSIIRYNHIEIHENVTTFITGQSGCGKSTLLKLCNAYYTPDCGTILYKGTDISEIDTISLRREVLLISQQLYLFQGTIEENFKTIYEYREEECISKEMMCGYLNLCGADFTLDSQCEYMSGGEKQRVFLSIGLSLNPAVLMLDEPTSALDERTAFRVLYNIKEYCRIKGITLVVISHDDSLVNSFADEIIAIEKNTEGEKLHEFNS